MILLCIELSDFLITLLRIFPRARFFIVKKESAVAGIFRIDIQLARDDGTANNLRIAELNFVDGFDPVLIEHLQNNIAQQRAFCIDFRPDLDRIGGVRRAHAQRQGNQPQ